MPGPEGERDSILRRLEDLSLLVSRLQLELANATHDVQQPLTDFRHFVMDPEVGLVVRMRHLEANLKMLDEVVSETVGWSQAFNGLDGRLKVLEKDLSRRVDEKAWLTRDVVVAGVLAVVTAVVASLIVAKLHW